MLTFDQDWCPNWLIREILEDISSMCSLKGLFFVTDNADEETIEILRLHGLDVGLHPNFDNCYTVNEIIKATNNVLNIYPNAINLRAHRLQSSNLISEVLKEYFPQIEFNFSYINEFSTPKIDLFSTSHGQEKRVYMTWEDDVALRSLDCDLEKSVAKLSLIDNIMCDFHPIHLFLNTSKYSNYLRFRENNDIRSAKEGDLVRGKNQGFFGVYDAFLGLVQSRHLVRRIEFK
jgi:hypothetical protein